MKEKEKMKKMKKDKEKGDGDAMVVDEDIGNRKDKGKVKAED